MLFVVLVNDVELSLFDRVFYRAINRHVRSSGPPPTQALLREVNVLIALDHEVLDDSVNSRFAPAGVSVIVSARINGTIGVRVSDGASEIPLSLTVEHFSRLPGPLFGSS